MYKAIVLLDEWNITSSVRSLGYRMDWEKLQDAIGDSLDDIYGEDSVDITDWFVYVGMYPDIQNYADDRSKKLGFINVLRGLGYYPVVREGMPTTEGSFKANVDTIMSVDAMLMAQNIKPDIMVIVSGDADFAYVTRKLRLLGINVVVVSASSSMSSELRNAANSWTDISDFVESNFSTLDKNRGEENA